MSYEKLNKQLIELVGGKDNIKAVAHCDPPAFNIKGSQFSKN